MYIDTHCHLDDEKFVSVERTIDEFQKLNVTHVINMGCNIMSVQNSLNLSKQFNSVFFGAGIHPSDIDKASNEDFSKIVEICKDEKCVAIGEIGLDYHFLPFDKDKQIDVFISQIEIATDNKLPISVHCRDATFDMLNVLGCNKSKLNNSGVMHCFSGSKETCKTLLDLGFYIGFGGTLTFKNARNLLEICDYVPLDRILTETDSPYLSPEPYRGQMNTPKNIPIILDKIAKIKGVAFEKMAEIVIENAKTLFKKLRNFD